MKNCFSSTENRTYDSTKTDEKLFWLQRIEPMTRTLHPLVKQLHWRSNLWLVPCTSWRGSQQSRTYLLRIRSISSIPGNWVVKFILTFPVFMKCNLFPSFLRRRRLGLGGRGTGATTPYEDVENGKPPPGKGWSRDFHGEMWPSWATSAGGLGQQITMKDVADRGDK